MLSYEEWKMQQNVGPGYFSDYLEYHKIETAWNKWRFGITHYGEEFYPRPKASPFRGLLPKYNIQWIGHQHISKHRNKKLLLC